PIFRYSVFLCPAEDGIRDRNVTGVQPCALPILRSRSPDADSPARPRPRAGGGPGARAIDGRSARPRNWGTRPSTPDTGAPRAVSWAPGPQPLRGPAGGGRIRAPQYRPVSFIQRITKVAIWSRLM